MTSATPHIDAAREACASARVHFAERLALRSREGVACRVSVALQESAMLAIATEREAGAETSDTMTALAGAIADLLSSQILALEASCIDGVQPDRAVRLFNQVMVSVAATFLRNVQRNANMQPNEDFLWRQHQIPPQGSA